MPAVPTPLPICQPFAPYPLNLNKGAIMQNAFRDVRQDGEYAVRRQAISSSRDASPFGPVTNGLVTQQIQGFNTNIGFIIVGGAAPVAYSSTGGTQALAAGGTTYTNDWMSYIDAFPSGSYKGWLAAQDAMWGVNNNGLNLVSTFIPGSPTRLCPGLAFLDGTGYCMSATDNLIHGSALQDLTTWPALNVVGASSSWGQAIGISRHLNYVLGFFENGLQVYYNAGLAPPGSPLAPLPNASFLVGCTSGFTVVSMADTTIFVGKTAANNYSVYKLSGLSLSIVSNSAVDAILKQNITQLTQTPRTVTDQYPQSMAYSITDKGHIFYCLKIGTSAVLAWDTLTQEWYVWTQSQFGVEVPYLPNFSADNFVAGSDRMLGILTAFGNFDYSGNINVLIRTQNLDFGSAYKKFVHKLSVYGDTIPDTMTVDYSDDDYTTYSGQLTIPLSVPRKMVLRLGSFYERSFRFQYTGIRTWRLKKFEILVEGGSL
jgi:hypothetical protein